MDISIENHGTLFLFRPHTKAAEKWLKSHTVGETTWFGGALVVEHRYANDLAAGLKEEGFTLG